MGKGISIIVKKTGATTGKDISEIVESVTWEGRRGNPARTLTISLIDDDGYDHDRFKPNIMNGWHCLFKYDGTELFRGIFLNKKLSSSKTAEYTAYDMGIYLSNNRDTFCYENKTATAVFKDVCNRFGLKVGGAASTSYKIPDITNSNSTGWDTIEDALSLDYENTGERHYVFAKKGSLYLRKRKKTITQWVLETGVNVSDYSYEVDMEDIKTRIKLVSSEGKTLAKAKDTSLEKKIGIFQDVDTPDDSLKTAQIKALANSMLKESSKPERTLSLSNVLGIPDVISGVGVFIKIPHLDLKKTFYVDSDTHTFKDNLHTMSLDLNLALDVTE